MIFFRSTFDREIKELDEEAEKAEKKRKRLDSEMNKLDEMMAYVSAQDTGFAHVAAVDAQFVLLQRAWYILEIAKAHTMGMKQHLSISLSPCQSLPALVNLS